MSVDQQFTLDPSLWSPQVKSVNAVIDQLKKGKDVCLQSPTGSGKTRMASELLRYADQYMMGGTFYVNRKLLVTQTKDRLEALGMSCGVRAADHEESFDSMQNIQIASAQTEWARVYSDNPTWNMHSSGLIIVDEAHIQKGAMMQAILKDHKANGANVVLLSATPIGLSKYADVIVSGGTMEDYRKCGALVWATVKSIEQPDLRKVKRTQSGEYVLNNQVKKIYTQSIVGNVIKYWKQFNPGGTHTMLYAPGKPESLWFTQQFEKIGVRWCHVDATDAWLDGKRVKLTRTVWEDILGEYTNGKINGISSRFKLREGIDVPQTHHVILATPIGSLGSYLQSIGRALRTAPGKTIALIQDHGGNYLRHGSPNVDRPWDVIWQMSSGVASKLYENRIRNRETPEPICCPQCFGERLYGAKCPHCGFEHPKGQRRVIQEDGKLVTVDGQMMKCRPRKLMPDTQRLWDQMYFGFKNKRLKRTFAQMEAFFVYQHKYWPERTLNNMPLVSTSWHRYVRDVPAYQLRKPQQKEGDSQ